jgi:hypothetical protein
MIQTATYMINADRADVARAIIAKAAKKATRLGLEPITVTEGPLCRRKSTLHADRDTDVYEIPFTLVTGAALTLGWSLIARIDHIDGASMIFAAPGEAVPADYRTRCACDHCHATRRRAQTYIVRAPAAGCPTTGTPGGTYRQIGRNCLAAYIGSVDAAAIMERAALLSQLEGLTVGGEDEDERGGGGRYHGCDPLSVVALSVALYAKDGGYISRTAAENSNLTSHASEIRRQLWTSRLKADERITPTDAQIEEARAAIAWAAALPEGDSDYLFNLRTLGTLAAEVDCWPAKAVGIGASLYSAHRRALGAEERRARLAALPPSTYLGEVGGKVTDIPATITRTHIIDSAFGATTLICFTATIGEARHELIWFASNPPEGWTIGAEVRLDATIKAHQPDKRTDAPVTVITRARPAAPPKPAKVPKARKAKAA